MTPRRLFALGSVGAVTGIAVACSFPDVDFAVGEGTEAGSDANLLDGDGATESGAVADAGGDVVTRPDGSHPIDPDACAPTNCDCDKDGYLRIGCDAGPDAAPDASYTDCDDYDELANPGQTNWVDAVPSARLDGGDWNCDGKVERRIATTDNQCKSLLGLGCTGGGFYTNPPCGTEAKTFNCSGAGCTEAAGLEATQVCK